MPTRGHWFVERHQAFVVEAESEAEALEIASDGGGLVLDDSWRASPRYTGAIFEPKETINDRRN